MGSADWDTYSDYSDRHWPAGLAEDIDSVERRGIPGPRLVDWGRQDCWNRDFLAALGSSTDCLEMGRSRRIAAVGFDKGHRLAESSLERMDSPERVDILAPSGNLDWDIRAVALRLVVRRDWH